MCVISNHNHDDDKKEGTTATQTLNKIHTCASTMTMKTINNIESEFGTSMKKYME
jgi:hypothetical protein